MMRSISTKVFVPLSLVIFILLSAEMIFVSLTFRASIRNNSEERVHSLLAHTENDLNFWFQERLSEMDALANVYLDKEDLAALFESTNKLAIPRVERELKALVEREAILVEASIIDRKGRLVVSTHPQATLYADFSDRHYFTEALAGRSTHTDVLTSRITREKSFVLSMPIKGERGGIAGVLVYEVSLNKLLPRFFKGMSIGEGADVYILSSDGLMLSSALEEQILSYNFFTDYLEASPTDDDFTEQTLYFEHSVDGKKKATYLRNLSSWSWVVAYTIDTATLYADLRRIEFILWGANTIVLIVVLAFGFFLIRRGTRAIRETTKFMKRIAEGEADISQRIEIASKDEGGKLAESFNAFMDKIEHFFNLSYSNLSATRYQSERLQADMEANVETVSNMTANIELVQKRLAYQSERIASGAERNEHMQETLEDVVGEIHSVVALISQLNERIVQQAASVNEIASAIEEMSKTTSSIAKIATAANNSTRELSGAVGISRDLMTQTTENMTNVLEAVSTLSTFVGSIANVAQQTNLLAMNAAIEAAHAGEMGKGFAVVAEEIRKLADFSNSQADSAQKTLREIENDISITSEGLNESDKTFFDLIDAMTEMTETMNAVNNATNEQAAGATEIVSAVTEVSQITGEVQRKYADINMVLNAMRNKTETLSHVSAESEQATKDLEAFSAEINGAMDEVARFTSEMNIMIQRVSDVTGENTHSIKVIEGELGRYKEAEDVSAPANDGESEIKGSVIIPAIKFIQTQFGMEAYERFLKELPPAPYKIFTEPIDEKRWYLLNDASTIPTRTMCRLFYPDDPDQGAWELGYFSANESFQGLYRTILSVGSPKFFVQLAVKILPTYYKPIAMHFETVDSHSAALAVTSFPGVSREVEMRILGWTQAAFDVCRNNGKVSIVTSLSKGDSELKYAATWD